MLDRTQPHDQVFGLPGVSWSQGGVMFDPNGRPVTFRREGTTEGPEKVVIERVIEAPTEPKAEGLAGMHWKHLAAMLEQYGETYTSKEAAVAFLQGKGVS